ncbi:hypothetical protein vseg_016950 [Gypsophila vaccaria]
MNLMTKHNDNHLFHIILKIQQNNNNTSSPQFGSIMHSSNSDFPIAIALLAIMAIALLLASYYIFVIKCCLNWHNLDPLRRFSLSRPRENDVDTALMSFSPMVGVHRGLDEWLINNIPAFQFKSSGDVDNNNNNNNESNESNSNSSSNNNNSCFRGCVVCLSEFKDQEILRILPKCSHTFHLDCIDVWLLKNASCPLCRSNISGRTKYPIDQIIAPNSSPQEALSPYFSGNLSINNINDQDYLVIEVLSQEEIPRNNNNVTTRDQKHVYDSGNVVRFCKKSRKSQQRPSIMGDECINIRPHDDQFSVHQPIRRSVSMDSAIDRGLYLQVQEFIRHNNNGIVGISNITSNEVSCNNTSVHDNECNSTSSNNNNNNSSSSRVKRSSFFSFGHGRGSRSSSSILPLN